MQIGGWQDMGGGGNGDTLLNGLKVLLWGVRNVSELGRGGGCTTLPVY